MRAALCSRWSVLLPLALVWACEADKADPADGDSGSADGGSDGDGEEGGGDVDGADSTDGTTDGTTDGGAGDGGDDGLPPPPPVVFESWGTLSLANPVATLAATDLDGDGRDELLVVTYDGLFIVIAQTEAAPTGEVVRTHRVVDLVRGAMGEGGIVNGEPSVYGVRVGGSNDRSATGPGVPVLLDVQAEVGGPGDPAATSSLTLRLDDVANELPTVTLLNDIELGIYATCSAQVADLDGDGRNEIVIEDSAGLRLWRSASAEWASLAGPSVSSGRTAYLYVHALNLDSTAGLDLYVFNDEGLSWAGARTIIDAGDGFGAPVARGAGITGYHTASTGEDGAAELVLVDLNTGVWSAGAGRADLSNGVSAGGNPLGYLSLIGELNGLPGLDLLRTPSAGNPTAHIGDGMGGFREAELSLPGDWTGGLRGDWDGDGIDDLVYAAPLSGGEGSQLTLWRNASAD
ncbi:MAG: hypothetical protein JNM72_21055 [Deltaproteobacteria bacterium]|nr:hypothetical protein [Deltaproteobacteria bacterium]